MFPYKKLFKRNDDSENKTHEEYISIFNRLLKWDIIIEKIFPQSLRGLFNEEISGSIAIIGKSVLYGAYFIITFYVIVFLVAKTPSLYFILEIFRYTRALYQLLMTIGILWGSILTLRNPLNEILDDFLAMFFISLFIVMLLYVLDKLLKQVAPSIKLGTTNLFLLTISVIIVSGLLTLVINTTGESE